MAQISARGLTVKAGFGSASIQPVQGEDFASMASLSTFIEGEATKDQLLWEFNKSRRFKAFGIS
jgi:hypothetical protein